MISYANPLGRHPGSNWSERNREIAKNLIEEGRMTPLVTPSYHPISRAGLRYCWAWPW